MKKKLQYIIKQIDKAQPCYYGTKEMFGFDVRMSHNGEGRWQYELSDMVISCNMGNDGIEFSGRIEQINVTYKAIKHELNRDK